MANVKQELIKMMNEALELEHAARIQYLAHAELVNGIQAETIIARLREIAGDEEKHEGMFREMIGTYLGGEPSMGMGKTEHAREIPAILEINLQKEKDAIDVYRQIYRKVGEHKTELPYCHERLEHTLRHIIMDEEEHVAELSLLLAK